MVLIYNYSLILMIVICYSLSPGLRDLTKVYSVKDQEIERELIRLTVLSTSSHENRPIGLLFVVYGFYENAKPDSNKSAINFPLPSFISGVKTINLFLLLESKA